MKPNLIGFSFFVCERILREQDGVLSAIRLVDVFYYDPPSDANVKPVITVAVIGLGKALEDFSCDITLRLTTPSGKELPLGKPVTVSTKSKVANAPGGFNLQATFGLLAIEDGTYYVSAFTNDDLLGSAPITVLPRTQTIERSEQETTPHQG
jgi:hypothetical protein